MASKRWRCPKNQPATSQLPKWQVMQMTPLPSERASAMCSPAGGPADQLLQIGGRPAGEVGKLGEVLGEVAEAAPGHGPHLGRRGRGAQHVGHVLQHRGALVGEGPVEGLAQGGGQGEAHGTGQHRVQALPGVPGQQRGLPAQAGPQPEGRRRGAGGGLRGPRGTTGGWYVDRGHSAMGDRRPETRGGPCVQYRGGASGPLRCSGLSGKMDGEGRFSPTPNLGEAR